MKKYQVHEALNELLNRKSKEIYSKYLKEAQRIDNETNTPEVQALLSGIRKHTEEIVNSLNRLAELGVAVKDTASTQEDLEQIIHYAMLNMSIDRMKIRFSEDDFTPLLSTMNVNPKYKHPAVLELRKRYYEELEDIGEQFAKLHRFIEDSNPVVAYIQLRQAGIPISVPDAGKTIVNPSKPKIDLAKILPEEGESHAKDEDIL